MLGRSLKILPSLDIILGYVSNRLFQNSRAKTPGIDDANKIMKHRVTMVGWDLSDQYVVTAVNDHSLRVWHSRTARPVWELCVSM